MLKTDQLSEITDEQMNERLTRAREYTVVILKTTAVTFHGEGRPIVWEHCRRNMALQAAGVLPVVCPVTDGSDVAGIGIFAAPFEEVQQIVDRDPRTAPRVLADPSANDRPLQQSSTISPQFRIRARPALSMRRRPLMPTPALRGGCRAKRAARLIAV